MGTVRMDATAFDVLSAYRFELSRRRNRECLGNNDATWIKIGSLLQRAATVDGEERRRLLSVVIGMLRSILPPETWRTGPFLDDSIPLRDALSPRVRSLCEEIEDIDAPALAESILDAYLRADEHATALERGRCWALRARLAWKRGDHSLAQEYYDRVDDQARRGHLPELAARAAIGNAIVARLRGNYPQSIAAGRRAVDLAKTHGYRRLATLGHQTLMIAAVAAGDLDEALAQAWHAFRHVQGDERAEGACLVDLAQLFYDHGHIALAGAGFQAALKRQLPERIRLPALGGAALVAARQHDDKATLDFVHLIRRASSGVSLPYVTAGSMIDAAEACVLVGEAGDAAELRAAAAGIADTHGYHELTHRLEALAVRPPAAGAPATLSEESVAISRAVASLAGADV